MLRYGAITTSTIRPWRPIEAHGIALSVGLQPEATEDGITNLPWSLVIISRYAGGKRAAHEFVGLARAELLLLVWV